MPQFFIALLQIIPKNIVSYWFGWFFRYPFTGKWGDFIKLAFVKITGIKFDEAEFSLEHYATVEDIFTRKLKPGLRPIKGDVVSPSDGYLAVSRSCLDGELAFQAKGLYYSLTELLGTEATSFRPGWYTTIYLAPHNYHRVHSPVSGELVDMVYIPGKLWPVNLPLVRNFPNLFCENERLIFQIQTLQLGIVYVVMVGAMNVGRMTTPFAPDFFTNNRDNLTKGERIAVPIKTQKTIHAGDEIGTFMLGSTVIVVFSENTTDSEKLSFRTQANNIPILQGESLLK